MRLFQRHCAIAVCGGVFFMLQTMCNHQVNPVEHASLQGNIVGKISTTSGKPAKGATVYLTPSDYNPFKSGDSGNIVSTTTNDEGGYAFSVQSSGFYNVTSRSSLLMSYQDSVYGAQNMQFEAHTDTLREPGSITGTVRLRPGDDNRSVIILVVGTSKYTQPEDTSGAFVISSLAEGTYRLKIITTEDGYSVLDTSIRVVAGEITNIASVLEIPWVGLPAIGPVQAELNSAMQIVTLSWPQIDTTNVKQLYVFRNTDIAQKPFAILKNKATVFVDDSLSTLQNGDSLQYIVAACGADGTIGPVGIAPVILYNHLLTRIGTIPLGQATQRNSLLYGFTIDSKCNVFLYGTGWVTKLDSTGRLIAEYCDTLCDQSGSEHNIPSQPVSLTIDNLGNAFMRNQVDSTLLRFSDDLTILSSCKFLPGLLCMPKPLFADEGQLFIDGCGDTLWKLDTSMQVIDTIIFTESAHRDLDLVHNGEFILSAGRECKLYFVDTADLRVNDSFDLEMLQPRYDSLINRNEFIDPPPDIVVSSPFQFTGAYADNVMVFNNGYMAFRCGQKVFIVNEERCLIGKFEMPDMTGQRGFFTTDGVERFFAFHYFEGTIGIYKINWNETNRQ